MRTIGIREYEGEEDWKGVIGLRRSHNLQVMRKHKHRQFPYWKRHCFMVLYSGITITQGSWTAQRDGFKPSMDNDQVSSIRIEGHKVPAVAIGYTIHSTLLFCCELFCLNARTFCLLEHLLQRAPHKCHQSSCVREPSTYYYHSNNQPFGKLKIFHHLS